MTLYDRQCCFRISRTKFRVPVFVLTSDLSLSLSLSFFFFNQGTMLLPESQEDPNMLPELQHALHVNHLNHKSVYLQKFRLYETRSVIFSIWPIFTLLFFNRSTWSLRQTVFFVCLHCITDYGYVPGHQLDFVYQSICFCFCLRGYLLFVDVHTIVIYASSRHQCLSAWGSTSSLTILQQPNPCTQLQKRNLTVLNTILSLLKMKYYSLWLHVCRHSF